MSSNNNSTASINIGFPGLLTLLFIGLKLTNQITWSWVWVLSPLWISFALVLLIVGIILLVSLVSEFLK